MSQIKECSKKAQHANNPDYVCNPLTGRWIKKDGDRYKELISKGFITAEGKPTEKLLKIPFKAPVTLKKPVVAPPLSPTKKECSKDSDKAKDPEYICNPLSGLWIKKGGRVYNDLVKKGIIKGEKVIPKITIKPSKKPILLKPCVGTAKPNYVCDPLKGQWIEKCGVAYQNLIENKIINKKGE